MGLLVLPDQPQTLELADSHLCGFAFCSNFYSTDYNYLSCTIPLATLKERQHICLCSIGSGRVPSTQLVF
jgi:hypothetical protein